MQPSRLLSLPRSRDDINKKSLLAFWWELSCQARGVTGKPHPKNGQLVCLLQYLGLLWTGTNHSR
eukprot:1939969-Amphidinium_carterae.1